MKKIAIVTGASSGIGQEFVRQIDGGYYGRLDEIWVIARRTKRLQELSRFCYTPAKILTVDLADQESIQTFVDALDSDKPEVKLLVNCAGWGRFEQFAESKLEDDQSMLDVNCKAVVEMTYHVLPYVSVGSKIINVASSAAFVPLPGAAIYGASKSFVLRFSRALHYELKDVGVTVTCVCPKAVATEFFDHVGGKTHMEQSIKNFGVERPYDVVRVALADTEKGKDLSISSIEAQALRVIGKVVPTKVIFAVGEKMGFF